MSFKPQCGCLKHNELTEGVEFSVKKLSQRPFKKVVLEKLKQEKLLPDKALNLCTVCAEYSDKQQCGPLKKCKTN